MKLDRCKLIADLAQEATDNADTSSLMEYFFDGQAKYFEELTDSELKEHITYSSSEIDIEDYTIDNSEEHF